MSSFHATFPWAQWSRTLFTFAYSHKREAGKQSWSLLFLFVEKYDFVNSWCSAFLGGIIYILDCIDHRNIKGKPSHTYMISVVFVAMQTKAQSTNIRERSCWLRKTNYWPPFMSFDWEKSHEYCAIKEAKSSCCHAASHRLGIIRKTRF